jgi:hypothetical protein
MKLYSPQCLHGTLKRTICVLHSITLKEEKKKPLSLDISYVVMENVTYPLDVPRDRKVCN